jgi:hypothetical protein
LDWDGLAERVRKLRSCSLAKWAGRSGLGRFFRSFGVLPRRCSATLDWDGVAVQDNYQPSERRRFPCPLAQPSKLFLSNSIDTGHQIDDSKRRSMQSQYPKLSVGWRNSPNQSATLCLLNLSPSGGTHPNVTVF